MNPDAEVAGSASMLPEQPAAPGQAMQPKRRDSLYSLRNWTPIDDNRCHSVSHMSLLMPLYLSPMLYYRNAFISCLYCLLLVLIMWALNAAPKPIVAVLYLVNLPMMNLMSAEELATQYLTLDALLLVILLYLVVLVDSLSDLVKRIAYVTCSRYGLRRHGVFLSLCGATFFAAMLISTVVLCVPLLYIVDRVFSVIYKESMDQQLTTDSPASRRSSGSMASNVAGPVKQDVENLFEKLAKYAHQLPKRSSEDKASLAGHHKQKQQKHQEKQDQQQPESSPEGVPQGEPSDAGQPGDDAAAAVGGGRCPGLEAGADGKDALAAPKEKELSAQPSSHVNDTSHPQGETKSPAPAAEEDQPPSNRPPHGRGDKPYPGNNNENNGEANEHHAAGVHAHQAISDDKHAVATADDRGNEDAAVTKHGGKKDSPHGGHSKHGGRAGGKDGPKEPGSHLVSKKKSKRMRGLYNAFTAGKTVSSAQANQCKNTEGEIMSPFSVEEAVSGELQLGPETGLSPTGILSLEPEASVLTGPGGQPQHLSEAFESRRHGKKRFKGHKGHKKAHHKSEVGKGAAVAAEAVQAVEATENCKAPGTHSSSVGSSVPGDGTRGIVKSSALDGADVTSPIVASSDTDPESMPEPAAFASTAGQGPGDQQIKTLSDKTSSATEKLALVINEKTSALAAAKEKEGSPEERSLTPAEAPPPALMQRRASILRQPGTVPRFGPTPGGGTLTRRRTSVVDFGAHEYAAYVPGDVVAKPRILSDTSQSNQSAASALVMSDNRGMQARRSISLRKTLRDDSRGIRISIVQTALNEEPSRKKRQMKRRADIHNAFLVGPSLMTVLGSLCSYWTGPAATALAMLSKNVPSPEPDMTASSWCVMTLPGCVAALLVGYCYLSWAQVLPYEPEDTNTEHSAAVQTAFGKLKSLGTPSLAGALVIHGSVLVLVMCVPAGFIGSDIRLTLLSVLTWTALLVSACGSLVAKTWLVVRHTWSRVPWGIVFVLGGVQVATKVVEDYGLLTQLFKLFKPSFWTARSHVEVQAILAAISSVLAETTNNRTLSLLMMPIVQDIAESKNMYPMYYAIPVVVGASSNVIMPISVPMVVMHELGRVPFFRLAMLGMVLKTVLLSMVLLTVNAVGRTLYDWGNQNVVPDT